MGVLGEDLLRFIIRYFSKSGHLPTFIVLEKYVLAGTHYQEKVKEIKYSSARFEQLYSFKIKKAFLWNDRDNALLKKFLRIGRAKEKPATQDDLIFELENEGCPKEIETGPFGVGVTWVATTICSTETYTDFKVMRDAATRVNSKFFHDVMQTLMDGTRQQVPDESISVQNGTSTFRFSNHFIRRGSSLTGDPDSLALFPELGNQLSESPKLTRKLTFFKILRASADEFGEDLGIEDLLNRAALAMELVYNKGYVYSIGQVTVDSQVKPKNLLMLGKTGVGKSLLGNVLLDKEVFKVSHSTRSCTQGFSELTENKNRKISLMDCRGFLDTSQIKHMIKSDPTQKDRIVAGRSTHLFD